MFRRDAVYFYIELLRKIILVSAGDCRFIRLRGGRSSADSARGTRPSGLPSIACGRDEGRICPFICAASARQKDGGPKGRLRQVFPHVSIIKFFDRADIVKWHSSDCGMKRHIPTDFVSSVDRERRRCVYRYPHVTAKVEEFSGENYIRVRLSRHSACCLKIGDVVQFCGNRVQIRQRFCTDFQWYYATYQRWDANGGFKDVRPQR